MNIVFVISHLRDWPFDLPGVTVVHARNYLMDPAWAERRDTRVFNLCNSYAYQGRGYYVSLLAEARGHKPLPDVKSIEDLDNGSLLKAANDALGNTLQLALGDVDAAHLTLEFYFGRHPDGSFAQLAEQLFNLLHVPLLQVQFACEHGNWSLTGMRALPLSEVATERHAALRNAAKECALGHCKRVREPAARRPRLAILMTADAAPHPSNQPALLMFQHAAEGLGIDTEIITKDDAGRLAEFDGLFIRDTTSVSHYTYQMSRQAALAGLVVIDDPDSILRCTNKVYLTELLTRHRIPIPKTVLVQRDNIDEIIPALGLPCVLKQPDGAFSQGVLKVHNEADLHEKVSGLLDNSAIILAQEYLPTEFDWRIGVLDRRAIFACKYFMAKGHWQIIKHSGNAAPTEGMAEAFSLGEVPNEVIEVAVKAANLIGDGFYGVDLKQIDGRICVIEINDNPNVDMGNEDGVLQQALYREVMGVFRKRIEAHKGSQQ